MLKSFSQLKTDLLEIAFGAILLFALGIATENICAAMAQADAKIEIETATASLQKGDLARAEAAARAVIAGQSVPLPTRAVALNILGIVSDQKEKFAEAESYYRKALDSDPGLIAARNNLGNLYFKTKREREAIAQYKIV